MTQDMSAFVERYQDIYEKDPDSKVFAPLAEAYRRMGLIDEAIELAESGVRKHPNFSSGRVALGKCYAQKNRHAEAIEHLKAAVEISPENILAHQLLAESQVHTGDLAHALQSYKMVLFMNPNDQKAAEIVQKLEKDIFFSSENGEKPEEFSMQKLGAVHLQDSETEWADDLTPVPEGSERDHSRSLERELALFDVRFERGQWGEARTLISNLFKSHPQSKEVLTRKQKLKDLESEEFVWGNTWLQPLGLNANQARRNKLEGLLQKIDARRRG